MHDAMHNDPGAGVFTGTSEMSALMRTVDWSRTPVGAVSTWPQSLKSAVSTMLECKFGMMVAWGPRLTHFYNDAYRPILGSSKHPSAGVPVPDVFPEIWNDVVGPLFRGVLAGTPVSFEDLMVPLDRHGFLEECFFTFCYSPLRDDGGAVGGVLVTVVETTARVVAERRLRVLGDLARLSVAERDDGANESAGEAALWRDAARVLAAAQADFAFALLYDVDDDGHARLTHDVAPAAGGSIPTHAEAWPIDDVVKSGASRLVELAGRGRALVLPVAGKGRARPFGVLVVGLSPRLALDEQYRDFLGLAADQIGVALGHARALAAERKRAQALAALDREKTAFFSNVSHEFRTPLTLLLGPAEELLAGRAGALAEGQRAQVELIRRNALRMQRLVNALLDFARLEAGRAHASYRALDLAQLTRDVASSFRSAIDRAGLRLVVDVPPELNAVVDPSMWEHIVLNLLSNAFKFTFDGEIAVTLRLHEQRDHGDHVELVVRDSGVGIAPENVSHLFRRFHRIEGTPARTHEGSGIGLALVRELVELHGGTVSVDSTVGNGTAFTVRIPRRAVTRTLEPAHPGRTAEHASLYVEEALRWLPSDDALSRTGRGAASTDGAAARPRVLVADDNADMRDYLRRLLEGSFLVETVADGAEALSHMRARPADIVITDGMMPRLSGLALIRELKADRATASIPIVLLSARAGEDARVEGLAAGADDYLVKPFGAAELVARVHARLRGAPAAGAGLASLASPSWPVRADHDESSEARFRAMVTQLQTGIAETDLGGRFLLVNERFRELVGRSEAELLQVSLQDLALLAPDRSNGRDTWHRLVELGAPAAVETPVTRPDGTTLWVQCSLSRIDDVDGKALSVAVVLLDVTQRKFAELALKESEERFKESEERFRAIFDDVDVSIWEADFSTVKEAVDELAAVHGASLRAHLEANPDVVMAAVQQVRVRDVNPATLRMFGASDKASLLASLESIFAPETMPVFIDELLALAADRRAMSAQATLRRVTGERIDVLMTMAFTSERRSCDRALITLVDVSARQIAEEERHARLLEMERALRFSEMFVGVLGHDLRNPLNAVTTAAHLIAAHADSEKVAKPAARILVVAGRMERMITQLLDFTRIRLGGGLPLSRVPVDLAAIAAGIVDELEHVYARNVRIERRGDVRGEWDGDRLSQLLSNLVANACQHGAAGRDVVVDIDGSDVDRVRLRVSNGGTIPAEILAVVFEPLRSSSSSSSSSGGRQGRSDGASGLGLGLYITEQIALAHGGSIRVGSRDDETSFTVELPRRR